MLCDGISWYGTGTRITTNDQEIGLKNLEFDKMTEIRRIGISNELMRSGTQQKRQKEQRVERDDPVDGRSGGKWTDYDQCRGTEDAKRGCIMGQGTG